MIKKAELAAIVCLLLISAILVDSAAGSAKIHLVKKGECLSAIGRKYGLKWQAIARINKIRKPFLIYPGQKLTLTEIVSKDSKEALAKIHLVKKGECLSAIGRKYGLKWQAIARINKIRKPFLIYPGQRVLVPDLSESKKKRWVPGTAPTKASPLEAVGYLPSFHQLSRFQQREIRRKMEFGEFKEVEIKDGWEVKEMSYTSHGETKLILNRIADLSKTGPLKARLYQAEDAPDFVHILFCNNISVGEPLGEPLIKKPSPKYPPIPVFKEPEKGYPPIPVFKEPQAPKAALDECGFDFYLGGGNYESVNYDADGYYFWGKARFRPLGPYKISERPLIRACLGVFGFRSMGEGHDEGYKYQWDQWNIGPSVKLFGSHWDADLDIGAIGSLHNKGGISLYGSRQKDKLGWLNYQSAHLNIYPRRDAGKKILPKTEFNLEARWPENDYHLHEWDGWPLKPDPADNSNWEIAVIQHLYDFKPSQNTNTLITPGFNFSFIREMGRDDPEYVQFGPRMTLSWRNKDIASVSFLNYKENLGGDGDQWHWLSGYLNIGGIVKAWRASQIEKAKPSDLVAQ